MKAPIHLLSVFLMCLVVYTTEFIFSGCRGGNITLTLPEKMIYRVVHPDSSDNRYLLLTPYRLSRWKDGQLLVMDKAGNIYFQKNVSGSPYCFRQWVFGGKRFYSYLSDDSTVYHIPKISLAAGVAVILDSAFREIRRIRLLPFHGTLPVTNSGLDLHDLIMLSPDHFIVAAVVEQQPKNVPSELRPAVGLKLAVPVIQEVQGDSVVWQWVATDFPELYSISSRDNNFGDLNGKHDYLHINSISVDPADSNLIVSFRHADAVIKISRRSGSILWKLGGLHSDFELNDTSVFYKQHSVFKTATGELIIFDNGDKAVRPHSRIVWFRLDEINKRVRTFRSVELKEPFSLYMGSAEESGDTLLVSGGTANYLLGLDLKTGKTVFEIHTNMAQYRVYQADNISGLPHTMDQPCIRSTEDTMRAFINKPD